MEAKVFITALKRYPSEGAAAGEWFDVPVDLNQVERILGIRLEEEEIAIHDYEGLPFKVPEHTSINWLNDICMQLEEIEGTNLYHALGDLVSSVRLNDAPLRTLF